MYIGTVGRRRPSLTLPVVDDVSSWLLNVFFPYSYCSANKNIVLVLSLAVGCCCCWLCMHCCCLRRAAFSLHISPQRTQLQKSINCNESRIKAEWANEYEHTKEAEKTLTQHITHTHTQTCKHTLTHTHIYTGARTNEKSERELWHESAERGVWIWKINII